MLGKVIRVLVLLLLGAAVAGFGVCSLCGATFALDTRGSSGEIWAMVLLGVVATLFFAWAFMAVLKSGRSPDDVPTVVVEPSPLEADGNVATKAAPPADRPLE